VGFGIVLAMSELSFAPAHQEDVPVIVDILTDANQYKLQLGDEIWGTEGWSKEEVADEMTKGTMYLVKHEGEVIGTVLLQWEDEINWGPQPPVAGYMHRLAVKEGYRGQNLGEKIVGFAEEQTARHGREFLRLDCEAANADLCAYYEGLGFERVATIEAPGYDDYTAALYEKRVLPAPS
jgi:ribosomal protein S18 acetylase RimI-like enzyme